MTKVTPSPNVSWVLRKFLDRQDENKTERKKKKERRKRKKEEEAEEEEDTYTHKNARIHTQFL